MKWDFSVSLHPWGREATVRAWTYAKGGYGMVLLATLRVDEPIDGEDPEAMLSLLLDGLHQLVYHS